MKKLYFLTAILFFSGIGTSKAQYTVLLNFNGTNSPEGVISWGSLALSQNKLYGMTGGGGANSLGCVFSMDTNGNNYKDLLDFDGPNGSEPQFGTLTLFAGVLYGMTYGGGQYAGGNIFSIDTNGSNYNDMYDFGTTNPNPTASLILVGDKLYGMTPYGGAYENGNIFYIYTNGTGYNDLYDFNSGTNGEIPYGSLAIVGKKLYGATTYGGTLGDGNIFSFDTSGTGYKDLFDFNETDGEYPCWGGALTFSQGKLYGMAEGGGAYSDGCIFSMDTNGTGYTDMLDFTGTSAPNYGAQPSCALTLAGSVLYGATPNGGANNYGCIFSIETDGTGYSDLFDFTGTTGSESYGSLTLSGNLFYGMTLQGGANSDGVVFNFKDANITTSVNELKANPATINIYPNPNKGTFTVALSHAEFVSESQTTIEVYNVLGEKVYTSTLPPPNGGGASFTYEINISSQPDGVYLYRVLTETGVLIGEGKIVIEK